MEIDFNLRNSIGHIHKNKEYSSNTCMKIERSSHFTRSSVKKYRKVLIKLKILERYAFMGYQREIREILIDL